MDLLAWANAPAWAYLFAVHRASDATDWGVAS
jgi:hypothetical protein